MNRWVVRDIFQLKEIDRDGQRRGHLEINKTLDASGGMST